MIFKDGVIFAGLDIRMRPALMMCEQVYKKFGRPEGVTITAGLDGEHSAGSLHYYGLAFDIRTHYFDDATKNEVAYTLIRDLGSRFTVVLEPTHIHVQLNIKEL
jgi:hypothetical protein